MIPSTLPFLINQASEMLLIGGLTLARKLFLTGIKVCGENTVIVRKKLLNVNVWKIQTQPGSTQSSVSSSIVNSSSSYCLALLFLSHPLG